VQFLIYLDVIAKLFTTIFALGLTEVLSLASVEDTTDHILRLARERNWLTEPTCDHFAEKGVFKPIIEEDGASLHVEKVGQDFHKARQVEF
jgi:hypothetical protein